jgi:lipoyl(octanoyl) transferase
VANLGVADYDAALELQETLRDQHLRGEVSDVLLLLQHPPVYTLGRGARLEHLGAAARGPVPVRRVGRGGGVTFHGRGQLVGYPIIDLSRHRRDVHAYVRCLEDALIRTVASLGGVAERLAGQPGVWMSGHKLASIGIGVKRWVTTHGFALNVTTDLAHFDAIVACGLPDVRMTSLAAEGLSVDIGDVGAQVAQEVAGELGLRCEVSDVHVRDAAAVVPVA